MFIVNGKKYKEENEYCFREENEKNLIEFFIQNDDNTYNIDFTTYLTLEELNNSEIEEEILFNEYLINNDIVLKNEKEFINLSIDDIDVRLKKILKNNFEFYITISQYKIEIKTNIKFEKDMK